MDENEDEFGDFGGFEAAEPVSENIAHGGMEAFPVEASPTPWAVLSSSNTVGVKPDLLHEQNKYPPFLDPSVPNLIHDEGIVDQNDSQSFENEIMPDFVAKFDQVPCLDETRFADDPHASRHFDIEKCNPLENADKCNLKTPKNIPDVQDEVTSNDVNKSSTSGKCKPLSYDTQLDAKMKLSMPSLQNTELTCEIVNSEYEINYLLSGPEDARLSSKMNLKTLDDKDKSEKTSSVKKLDCTTDNKIDTEQKMCTGHSKMLNEELKAIRKESHLAVTAVIEEYQDLLKNDFHSLKEKFEKQLAKSLEEQQKSFHQKIHEQQLKYKQMLREEKIKMEEEYKVALKSQAEKQQKLFDLYIQEERKKNKDNIEKAVMETIQKKLEDERLVSEESLNVLTDSIKKEMVEHLEQKKQLDRVTRQRQLASLDVFIESAKRQLTFLMDSECSDEKVSTKS